MNTIKLEIPFNTNNVELVKDLLSAATSGSDSAKNVEVTDAKEVKAPAKKAPAKRPAPKKVIEEEEEIEDEFETDGDFDGPEEEEEEEEEDEITEDTLRDLSAKKIGKHKDAIIAQLAKYKVKGWANLPEKHYKAMADFLTKLK